MCPTVVVRDGRPALAVGARGGRRIPNCVLNVLLNYCGRKRSIEDSVAGIRSAKAAGMRVIAVPPAHLFDDPAYGEADAKLRSLAELTTDMLR